MAEQNSTTTSVHRGRDHGLHNIQHPNIPIQSSLSRIVSHTLETEVDMRNESTDGSDTEMTGAHLSTAAEENTPLLASSDARESLRCTTCYDARCYGCSRYVGYKSTYLIKWF